MYKRTQLHRQIEQELGFRIEKVESKGQLDACLRAGLVDLYQEAFKAPPYNEDFSAGDVTRAFHDYLGRGGHIFVAVNGDGNRPVGFIVSVPVKSDFNVASKMKGRLDLDRSGYCVDDAVAQDYRRAGISSKLKQLLLEHASLAGMKNMVSRTSQYNYKQVSAFNKTGATIVAGVFQDVAGKRLDGSVAADRRLFYIYDLEAKDMDTRKLDRVVVARPGGNDTAFVFDQVPRSEQADLSAQIQESYPGIEQVMFVEKGRVEAVHGQMAGGEFCGNATRSLGFVLSGGREGKICLEVSNGDGPVRAEVVIVGNNAQTSVPVRPEFGAISRNAKTGEYTVDMGGIAFLVTTPGQEAGRKISAPGAIEEKKDLARKILEEAGLARKPASGLLVMQKTGGNALRLDPFVLVRDTGSLYYESGCGSGSTALGAIAALEQGASVRELEVVQPSGMSLYVTVERDEKQFLRAFVDGPVEIISDGSMYLTRPAEKATAPARPPSLQQRIG